MKYTYAKGWDKEKVMAKVREYNNGYPSIHRGSCVYLDESNNNRCAIGCFIPDGHKALSDVEIIEKTLEIYPDLIKHMPFNEIEGLQKFQTTHDTLPENVKTVYQSLEKFLTENVKES